MMMDNLDDILCVLHKSKDEEEIKLKIIIKSFNISLYKELLSNPYFSSLIIDIKDDIEITN
jgi:hypothetical protein